MNKGEAGLHEGVQEFFRGERLRVVAPHLLGIGLPLGVALVFIGVLALHQNSNREAELGNPIEQPIQRTDARPDASEKLELQIAILGRRVDDQFATLRGDLETASHSISRVDSSIGAVNARLDQEADVNARLDQQERESGTLELTALDKTVSMTPKVGKQPNPRVPHLGIGLTKATGLANGRGLVVAEVDPGSPAERAGVRQLDLLLKVDHTAVSNPDQMSAALLSLKGRHTVLLTLQREGKTQHVRLSLG
jgi:C-terminal processing protease CtpA/Prc